MDFRNSRRTIPAHPVKGLSSHPEAHHCPACAQREIFSPHSQVADILFDEVTKPSVDRIHLFNIECQVSGLHQAISALSLKPVAYPARSDEEFESYFVVDVS